MLEVFYLDVAYVAAAIHICCKCMFVNVLFISDVCCSKYFMLQVLHDQAWEVGADVGGLLVHAWEAKCARRPPHATVTARGQGSSSVPVGGHELHACTVGSVQAKLEVETRCTRSFC
jgi:hypothetical protein